MLQMFTRVAIKNSVTCAIKALVGVDSVIAQDDRRFLKEMKEVNTNTIVVPTQVEKMCAELASLNAAPFLSRAVVYLCWYYYTIYIMAGMFNRFFRPAHMFTTYNNTCLKEWPIILKTHI